MIKKKLQSFLCRRETSRVAQQSGRRLCSIQKVRRPERQVANDVNDRLLIMLIIVIIITLEGVGMLSSTVYW